MLDHAEQITRVSERQARRAWLEDGLEELMAGGLVLAAAGSLVALKLSPLFFPVFMLVFGLGPLAQLWFFTRLKRRIADPRTGYFRPRLNASGRYIARRSQRSATLIAVGVCLVGGAIPFLAPTLPWQELSHVIWWATVVGSAVLAGYTAWITGLRRLYLYAFVSLAAIAGRFAGLDDDLLVIAYLVADGLIALIGGTLALRSYLRRNPSAVAR